MKPTTPGAGTSADQQHAADVASDAAADVKQTAKDMADSAKAEAAARAGAARDSMAEEVSDFASALRTAAGELRSGSPQERTLGQIAEGLADASDTIRNKDLGEAARDISDFARRNPLAFLGGAALVGFAATRFAKASTDGHAGSTTHTRGHSPSAPAQPVPATPKSTGGTA